MLTLCLEIGIFKMEELSNSIQDGIAPARDIYIYIWDKFFKSFIAQKVDQLVNRSTGFEIGAAFYFFFSFLFLVATLYP